LDDETYYSFPSVTRLSQIPESELRALGFGYRARFVGESARRLLDLGADHWLHTLRGVSRLEARQALLELSGVGRKVADCVSLFALEQLDALPVDTHVWQIACRWYLPFVDVNSNNTVSISDRKDNRRRRRSGSSRSVISDRDRDRMYELVGACFRTRFGPYCGWAHVTLFAADLAIFKPKNMSSSNDPLPQPRNKSQETEWFPNTILQQEITQIGDSRLEKKRKPTFVTTTTTKNLREPANKLQTPTQKTISTKDEKDSFSGVHSSPLEKQTSKKLKKRK